MTDIDKTHLQSEKQHQYIAIDLKSYYASCECVARHLDPLSTNLVVADTTRTEKTICLAVSPSLKDLGVASRPRLFEVVQKIKALNSERLYEAVRREKAVFKDKKPAFFASSFDARALGDDISLEVSYIVAPPRMTLYEEISSRIYSIYLKYVSPEDILVYSIDEVFMDVTGYLGLYGMSAWALAMTMIRDVLYTTGITATAGIGTNMYLAKIAMDIVAKKAPPDKDGVRIASLDEFSYRKLLWTHEPLTDFWRIGRGITGRLNKMGLYTMGDVARCSVGREDEYYNEDLLYRAFGINAELLIDHAWGFESCRMSDAKAYIPKLNSLSTGQVLPKPYTFKQARNVVMEMADTLVLELTRKGLCTNRIGLGIGYEAKDRSSSVADYQGKQRINHYGKTVPQGVHVVRKLSGYVSGVSEITDCALDIFDEEVDPDLLIRRIGLVSCDVRKKADIEEEDKFCQLSLFTDYCMDYCGIKAKAPYIRTKDEKEMRLEEAVLKVKKRFGKNSLVKGINFKEGAREIERNEMIGGHKA